MNEAQMKRQLLINEHNIVEYALTPSQALRLAAQINHLIVNETGDEEILVFQLIVSRGRYQSKIAPGCSTRIVFEIARTEIVECSEYDRELMEGTFNHRAGQFCEQWDRI